MKKLMLLLLFLGAFLSSYSQDNTTDTTNAIKNENNSSETNKNAEQKKVKNGWELYLDGRYIESINALEIEKKYHPERINIYVIEGWDYKFTGNYPGMEQVSLEGLKLDSEDLRIILNLADAYYLQKKYSQAIPFFEKYLSKRYNITDQAVQKIYYYLGDCYYNIKSFRKADISLSTAYHFIKNDTEILLKLALVKESLTENDKSIILLKQVLNIDPENNVAKETLARLEKK